MMILCGVGVPVYHSLIAKVRADATVTQLYRAVYLARSEAIKRNVVVTLCSSQDHYNCSGDWKGGYLVFVDQRSDGRVDAEDIVIKTFSAIKGDGYIVWKSFPRRNYLQMSPQGFTNNQNGTFYYYPEKNSENYTRSLIVSKTGRVRGGQ